MSARVRSRLDRVIASLGVALVIATIVVFAAHHDAERNAEAQPATPGPSVAVDEVPIKDFLYKPAAITVAAGTMITFTNKDSAPHTATSEAPTGADGAFDTGTLKKSQSSRIKVTKTGTFGYYCAIHPFMKATVIVK